jgi:YesN/AraC family two-component response regulator
MNRILIVEDERWVRTVMKKLSQKIDLPFEVTHELTNGIEATDWLDHNEVELVMTDIRMPVMDGIALLKDMRRKNIETAVILVTGHDDFEYAHQALRYGAQDYLLKPVTEEELQRCFQNWLDKQGRLQQQLKENQHVDINELSPVNQVIHHIESAVSKDMSLTEAASSVHLNPSYFCKLFKQETGINYRDYVTNVRINEAARLLETTSLRITEVSERLGYADLAYFSNTFKKIKGQTPSDFRKKLQEI